MNKLTATCLLPLAMLATRPPEVLAEPESAGKALPFLSDDYPAALAEARAREVPIFVEAWAPW